MLMLEKMELDQRLLKREVAEAQDSAMEEMEETLSQQDPIPQERVPQFLLEQAAEVQVRILLHLLQ